MQYFANVYIDILCFYCGVMQQLTTTYKNTLLGECIVEGERLIEGGECEEITGQN